MADEADIADERIEKALAAKQAEVVNRPPEAPFTGECLNCGADLSETVPQRRWCDAECCSEWDERRKKELLRFRGNGIEG